MRFFGALAVVATLATSVFVAASPLPEPAPVPAVVEKRQALDVNSILDDLKDKITDPLNILDGLGGLPISLDDILGPSNTISDAIQDAIDAILNLQQSGGAGDILGLGWLSTITNLAGLATLILGALGGLDLGGIGLPLPGTGSGTADPIAVIGSLLGQLIALILPLVTGILGPLLASTATSLLFTLLAGNVPILNLLSIGDIWKSLGLNLLGL